MFYTTKRFRYDTFITRNVTIHSISLQFQIRILEFDLRGMWPITCAYIYICTWFCGALAFSTTFTTSMDTNKTLSLLAASRWTFEEWAHRPQLSVTVTISKATTSLQIYSTQSYDEHGTWFRDSLYSIARANGPMGLSRLMFDFICPLESNLELPMWRVNILISSYWKHNALKKRTRYIWQKGKVALCLHRRGREPRFPQDTRRCRILCGIMTYGMRQVVLRTRTRGGESAWSRPTGEPTSRMFGVPRNCSHEISSSDLGTIDVHLFHDVSCDKNKCHLWTYTFCRVFSGTRAGLPHLTRIRRAYWKLVILNPIASLHRP